MSDFQLFVRNLDPHAVQIHLIIMPTKTLSEHVDSIISLWNHSSYILLKVWWVVRGDEYKLDRAKPAYSAYPIGQSVKITENASFKRWTPKEQADLAYVLRLNRIPLTEVRLCWECVPGSFSTETMFIFY